MHIFYCLEKKARGKGIHWSTFQNVGFKDWKNPKGAKHSAFSIHEGSEAHKDATVKASAFKGIVTGEAKDIHSSLPKAYEE